MTQFEPNKILPDKMRAVAINKFGGLNTLSVQTLPVPDVGEDEVLIHVESAGVGAWDPFEREGGFAKMYGTKSNFPYVLGTDGAGSVVAVGNNVERFRAGDRVCALALANPKGGFYAEYAVVNQDSVFHVPEKLTIEEAGVLPVDALTALTGLEEVLQLKPNESLMVFGASGGVGHLAVQLAKRMGARVFAVASGEDGVEFAKRIGADAVVDGREDDVLSAATDFAPQGFDAALLTAGGGTAIRALSAMHKGGRVAYPNGVNSIPQQAHMNVKMKKFDVNTSPQLIEKLNELINAGPFEVHIARTFELEEAAEAQRTLESHFLGKIALHPSAQESAFAMAQL